MTLRCAHNRFTGQAAHGLFAWVILAVLPASVFADELTLAGHWQGAIVYAPCPARYRRRFRSGQEWNLAG